MRPISLKLAGLHSYRELQEIDFEKLCEAGLFGIFGPTGSGKSTILDAITLALYGQVIRMGGSSHPQEVLNQLENRLFVSFTFELGKDGKRQRYTIEREFGLDKKGKKKPAEVRLIERGTSPDVPDQVIESKATAATALIEKLVGLTIHDFTRAVVLPQGQFSKFLTLKGSERNEMLQRIFHLQEYGEKLQERMRALYEKNRNELHRLEIELAGLGDAGPDALQAATSEYETTLAREQTVSAERESLFQRKKEMEQVREWQAEREGIRTRLTALQAEQAEIESLVSRISRIEASIKLWPMLEKVRELTAASQAAAETAARQRMERDEARAAFERAEEHFTAIQAEKRTEEPKLIQLQGECKQAIQLEEEIAVLAAEKEQCLAELSSAEAELEQITNDLRQSEQQLHDWAEELRELDGKLQLLSVSAQQRKHLQALMDVKKAWEREKQQAEGMQRDVEALQNQKLALESKIRQLELSWHKAVAEREQVQAQIRETESRPVASEEAIQQKRAELEQVKQLGKEWREAIRLEQSWSDKYLQWERLWRQNQALLQQKEREHEAALAEKTARLAEKERINEEWQAWQRSNMVRAIRSTMIEGEACPVCGAEHEHFALPVDGHQQETATERDEQHLRQQLEQCDAAVREAEQFLLQLHQSLQAVAMEQAKLAEQDKFLQEEKLSISEKIRNIHVDLHAIGEQWKVQEISELLQQYQLAEAQLQLQVEERTKHKTLLEALAGKLTAAREMELTHKAEYDKHTAMAEQLLARLEPLKERLAESTLQAERTEAQLHGLRGDMPVESVEAEYQRMEQQEADAERCRQQRQERETAWKELQAHVQAIVSRQTEKAVVKASLQERLQERSQHIAQKQEQWRQKTGGANARVKLAETEAALQRLRQAAEDAEQKWKVAAQHRQDTQEAAVKSEESCLQLQRQAQEAELLVQRGLLEGGFLDAAQVESIYADRHQLSVYQERVQSYLTLQSQLKYDEQRLTEKLAGRVVQEEEWQALKQAWDELENALQTLKEQLAVAKQALSAIQSNHEKWLKVHQQYQQISDEQSRLDDLRKLFEAKAFVQFIAEEKMAAIAKDASYHLRKMTKNRYSLEIGADGEFILRDEAAGGMRRPVATLSGGETFLTSLALALALSVEIQMQGGRLEFFFLDEGFGTLDPVLLEVVLDTLEKLRMNDFTIGLISHVPELRVRMPRRLVITPAEPMGAGSRIQLEIE